MKPLTRKEVVHTIANTEGKKVETPVGNVREIVRVIENNPALLQYFALYLLKTMEFPE